MSFQLLCRMIYVSHVHSGVAWSNAARCGSREIWEMRPPSPLLVDESTQNAAPSKCDPVRKSRNRENVALFSSLDERKHPKCDPLEVRPGAEVAKSGKCDPPPLSR